MYQNYINFTRTRNNVNFTYKIKKNNVIMNSSGTGLGVIHDSKTVA